MMNSNLTVSIRWIVTLVAVSMLVAACNFEPESARVEGNQGWELGDSEDAGEISDASSSADGDGTADPDGDGDSADPDGDFDPDGDIDLDAGAGDGDSGTGDGGTTDPDSGTGDGGTTDPDTGTGDGGTTDPDSGTGDSDPDPDTGTGDSDPDPDPDPDAGTGDADPYEICDGQEVDTSSDDDHCGACGNSCDPDFGTCSQGECVCSDSMEACGGSNRCEDLEIDSNHCGACGIECGPGAACQSGECVCRNGFTLCDGECVDTRINPNHCGACGENCGAGHCQDGECGSGGCGIGISECQKSGDDGVACMTTGTQSSLYCAPSWNTCGTECRGDQVCVSWTGCRNYRAARGCDSCPCSDCAWDEACRDNINTLQGPFCIGGQ